MTINFGPLWPWWFKKELWLVLRKKTTIGRISSFPVWRESCNPCHFIFFSAIVWRNKRSSQSKIKHIIFLIKSWVSQFLKYLQYEDIKANIYGTVTVTQTFNLSILGYIYIYKRKSYENPGNVMIFYSNNPKKKYSTQICA